MRELKFRAWDKVNNKMLPPCNVWEFGFDDTYGDIFADMQVNSKDLILMQYTGLKDINGEEIYEGDIVDIQQHDRYLNHKEPKYLHKNCKVKWDNIRCQFYIEISYYIMVDFDRIQSIWVVGNIYENNNEGI